MTSIKYIFLISFLFLAFIPLKSAEMWKFVPKEKFGGFIFRTENYENNQIIALGNKLYLFDGVNLQPFGNNQISEVGIMEIANIGNNIFITTNKNIIFQYTTNKEWKNLQFEDKYNAQDNKNRRNITKIASYSDKVYFLSYAMDIKSIDTISGGTIRISVNKAYNEIFYFDGNTLVKEYFVNTNDVRIYDIAADKEGIWASGMNTLYYIKDGELKDSLAIGTELGLDPNSIFSNIYVDDDYVYLLKQYTAGGAEFPDAYFVIYNKKTKKAERLSFPKVNSFNSNDVKISPSDFSNMANYGNHLYISTGIGIYQYFNYKLSYVDIFTQFLPEIPKVYYPYLSTRDIDISGDRFYITSNVGLIYTDAFTDVNDINATDENNLKLYPNIITESTRELTLESNKDMGVKSIELYDMSGAVVSQITNPTNIKKGINSLKLDYSISGKYFLTIKTMKDNFIVPLIIKK